MLQSRSNVPTIGVLGFPFSKGQPRRGTEHGPQVLREGGLIEKLKDLDALVIDNGNLELDSIIKEEPDSQPRNHRTVGAANRMLSDEVSKLVKMKHQVLILGGDHSMAIGSIHGHVQAEPDAVVVWIDAHADINTPLTSPSGNMHGMPLSYLVRELAENMPFTPGLDWCQPCLAAKDLVYIGLRDVDPGERLIIEELGIACYSMQEIDKFGIRTVLDMALARVDPAGQRPIHVSFDVDSVDPDFTAATGTPVPGGLSLREAFYIAEEISSTGRLSVLDLAEVNPMLSTEEKRRQTVQHSVEVALKFFGGKRQGTSPRDYVLPKPTSEERGKQIRPEHNM